MFNPPANWVQQQGQPYIKRVIGVGGDTVELKDGAVYVNGTKLNEPYVFKDENGNPQPTDDLIGVSKWVVPDGPALPDGRPPGELRRFAGVRAGRPRLRDRPGLAPLLADQHLQDHRHPDPPGARVPGPMSDRPDRRAT